MVGIRRENAISGGSSYQTPSTSVTIEEWVAQKDPFRVVAHGFPIIGRVPTGRCDPGLNEAYQKYVEPRIPDILSKYRVSHILFQMARTYPKNEHQNGQHRIIIHSEDTDTRAWSAVVKEVFHLFRTHDPGQHGTELQVEIQNSDRFYDDISWVLPKDSQLIEALEKVRPGIIKAAHKLIGSSWTSIAFHTRVDRYYVGPTVNGKTTIVIFCSPGSKCDYYKAEEEILKILEAIPFEIHLEFLPGQITPSATPHELLPNDQYQEPEKPVNGSSISVEGNTTKAGSLGGWVVLNLPTEHRTIRCILTCYSVIRPPNEEVAKYTDEHGIVFDDPRGHEIVEYPAAYDAEYTVSRLDDMCALNPNNTKVSQILNTLSSRYSNRGIGRVMLASGHRATNGYRSDWALIESPSTFSPNKPLPESALDGWDAPRSCLYRQNEHSEVREFGRARLGDWVAKRGRTMSFSAGEINNMERVVQYRGHITTEVEILSYRGDFARPGDSGSMVTPHQSRPKGAKTGRPDLKPLASVGDCPQSDERKAGAIGWTHLRRLRVAFSFPFVFWTSLITSNNSITNKSI